MACYLLTGGAGFIGSHTAEALLRRGDAVRILDDLSTGRRQNLAALEEARAGCGAPAAALRVLHGSVLDEAVVKTAVQGVDGIIHLAALPSVQRSWRDPLRSHRVNASGTFQVLLAGQAAGVRRFVLASSSSVYGNPPGLAPHDPKLETARPAPASPYAVSKLAAEHYCRLMQQLYGMETVVLRYFNVFGKRQDPNAEYAAVIPRFITAALRGASIEVHGDGKQSRDFTPIENVVRANLLALDSPLDGHLVCNIATGARTSIEDLAAQIETLRGAALERRHTAPRPGDVRHSLAALEVARTALGYEPTVSFAEGLRRTYEAFRNGA